MADASAYLDIYLGPLKEQMARPEVTDLYINKPGELWVETVGGEIERHDAPDLDDALLWRLARQVASLTHQAISREHPLLAATLPDGTRAQFIAPPATRGPMAVAFRRHVSANLTLDQLEAQGMFDQLRPGGQQERDRTDAVLDQLYKAGRWKELLRKAVKARKTILVSGGTSSGKTTFLNALLAEIEPHERLIVIEDTPELQLRQPNVVGLVAVRGETGETLVTTEDLIVASLRMRPDRIMVGELRGPEASAFIKAINTGHPGSMSSVHANDASSALVRVSSLTGAKNSHRHIDILAHLERRQSVRQISEIRMTNCDLHI